LAAYKKLTRDKNSVEKTVQHLCFNPELGLRLTTVDVSKPLNPAAARVAYTARL
jgi:hypothetical protein